MGLIIIQFKITRRIIVCGNVGNLSTLPQQDEYQKPSLSNSYNRVGDLLNN
jgi:hypothetical protein